MNKKFIFALILFLTPLFSYATHVRAGEITASRVPGTQLTYRLVLVTYTDEIGGKNANDAQEFVDFSISFSSGTIEKMRVYRKGNRMNINPATVRNVYDTTYTFPSSGYYTIGCSIVNRNANTVNLPVAGGSENISFYVQTSLLINPNIGFNSSPVLLNIPIDSAAVGQKFIHNPGAFDIDGDSLSYKLTIPRKDELNPATSTTTGRGIFIPEYLDPNSVGDPPVLNMAGTGPATFTIDPVTGDLVWDVPREPGQYNVAFIIEEWRKGFDGKYAKIGEIIRDMQIIVVETDNIAPVLTLPDDICIEAGEKVEFEVIGTDENEQKLVLSTSGGIYNLNAAGQPTSFIPEEAAKFTGQPSISRVVGKFEWQTNCSHAREQPYTVVFKVEDTPGRFITRLVDLKSLNIKVLPPSPKALVAEEGDSGNLLSWRPLEDCAKGGKVLVYRKSGCSGLIPGQCSSGIPSDWGYELIGEVSLTDSTFADTKAEPGSIYSYRLVTEISENEFIKLHSAPSIEFCLGREVKPGTALITRVSVNETSLSQGSVEVRWSKPVDVDLDDLIGPFVYKLYRATGIGGENFTLIHTQDTDFLNSNDTVYIDNGLNTEEITYRYKIEFYTENNKLMATSGAASSVKLNTRTSDGSVPLSWETNTPWSNDNQIHYIFRESFEVAGEFNLIKKLEVTNQNSYTYTDTGEDFEMEDGDFSIQLQNGETYCYVVMTQGEYEEYEHLGVLQNYSQVKCATPLDQSPPCTPQLTFTNTLSCEQMQSEDFCNENVFVNNLSWNNPEMENNKTCRDDIVSYNIYYTRYQTDKPELIATVPVSSNTYRHFKNRKEGFAGCYNIQARNTLGLLSGMSEQICFDNCDKLSFPNVFSPDGDGLNDTFTPMNCPAFIQSSSMKIYNAHGQLVRQLVSENIEWDGKNETGKFMPSGTYYYHISVTFERLAKEGSIQEYKGYVTLIR